MTERPHHNTTGPADRFLLAGKEVEGRFRIGRVVAEGGFGVVYEATQIALDRRVALKVLKTPGHLDDAGRAQFIEKFASEAKTIARMAHPSIVQVYDFGVSTMPNGELAPWMALEWLTGTTLESDLIARRQSPGRKPAECLALMKPVIEAIAYAHKSGVAHRDLKPANIMVIRQDDGSMVFKVLDFGIAKVMEADEAFAVGPTRTPPKLIAYSPAYAAPEQISHGRTGPWTDVHALALILVEMLTNRSPFEAKDLSELFIQILDRSRPTPHRRGVEVGSWEPVLSRALAVSGIDRFQNAAELLAALESPMRSSQPQEAPVIAAPAASASPYSGAASASPHATTANPITKDDPPLVVPTNRTPWIFIAAAAALLVLGVGITTVMLAMKKHDATTATTTAGSESAAPPPSVATSLPAASVVASTASSTAPTPAPAASSVAKPNAAPPPKFATPAATTPTTPKAPAGKKDIPVE